MRAIELQTANGIDNLTLVTRSVIQPGPGQVLVRANAQFNGIKAIEDPKPYQDFFAALEKSLFLNEQPAP